MSWSERFLALAQLVASWSKDPSTKVGAVVVDSQNRVVSVGFNGFPRRVADDERLLDRVQKYELIVHAEISAVLFAGRPVEGCTIYTWPLPPCSRCAAVLIQAGIRKVVSPPAPERWRESCAAGRRILVEAGIVVLEQEL